MYFRETVRDEEFSIVKVYTIMSRTYSGYSRDKKISLT